MRLRERRKMKHKIYATQGQGNTLVDECYTLEEALAIVSAREGEASFAIQYPSGTWHEWEKSDSIYKTKRFTLCDGRGFEEAVAQRIELYKTMQKGYPNEEFLHIVAQLYEMLKNDYLLLEERGSLSIPADSEIRKVIEKVKEEEELAELEHRREIGPP